jgi:proline dehydrogenase
MFESLPKAAFSTLASSGTLKRLASRYGMRHGGFARRFIAGETIHEAIAAAREIEAAGLTITLDYLGESVSTAASAAEATRTYLAIVRDVEGAGVGRNLSIKLTQLGLEVDRATSIDNVRRLLDAAATHNFFVRIDMERSTHTDETLDTFETLWSIGYRNAGVVLQANLRRSANDVLRMNALGARVRLVKGAYHEPAEIAFQQKHEVDSAFVSLAQTLLIHGTAPAIATHDPVMIDTVQGYAGHHGVGNDRYEFQMLYGVRRDLQTQLAAQGHPVRVYIPFGAQWFPYFMRRLGERPANVGFVVRNLMRH